MNELTKAQAVTLELIRKKGFTSGPAYYAGANSIKIDGKRINGTMLYKLKEKGYLKSVRIGPGQSFPSGAVNTSRVGCMIYVPVEG